MSQDLIARLETAAKIFPENDHSRLLREAAAELKRLGEDGEPIGMVTWIEKHYPAEKWSTYQRNIVEGAWLAGNAARRSKP